MPENKILQKCAEILVECGHADKYINLNASRGGMNPLYHLQWMTRNIGIKGAESVQPFADTIEGRRQADAIENWLRVGNISDAWSRSTLVGTDKSITNLHQWRLDRIKWCINELIK